MGFSFEVKKTYFPHWCSPFLMFTHSLHSLKLSVLCKATCYYKYTLGLNDSNLSFWVNYTFKFVSRKKLLFRRPEKVHESYLKTCSLKITVYINVETSGQDILWNSFFLTFFRLQDWFFSVVLGTHDQHICIPQMAEISGSPLIRQSQRTGVRRLPISPSSPAPEPQLQTAACEDQQINKPTAEIRTKTFHKYNVLNKMALFIHK